MVFVSNEVPFHGTECEVKTIALYSSALVGEDYYEKKSIIVQWIHQKKPIIPEQNLA